MGVALAESHKGIQDFGQGNSQIMLESAKSLIRCGGLDLQDWLGLKSATENDCLSLAIGFLALLPIILFYHEDEYWLEKQLKLAMSHWPGRQFPESDLMVVGWAIANVLRENLTSETTINALSKIQENARKVDEQVGENLAKIQRLIREYVTLDTAIDQLNKNNHPQSAAIYLAIYCFFCTPEQFQLSIQRAAQTQPQPYTTKLIAAALSGAYNGQGGMPMTKQLIGSDQGFLNLEQNQLITLADRLYATWLGLYAVDKHLEQKPLPSLMMMVTDPHQLVPPS